MKIYEPTEQDLAFCREEFYKGQYDDRLEPILRAPRIFPPHNINSERLVLGTYLNLPHLMNDFDQLRLTDFFIDLKHKGIHKYMREIGSSNLSTSRLKDKLRENNSLEGCGGEDYIEALVDIAHEFKGENSLVKNINILEEKYLKRRLIDLLKTRNKFLYNHHL